MLIKKMGFIAFLIILISGCIKNETKPCLRPNYFFEIDVKLSPEQAVFRVGDSIICSMRFSKNLVNIASGNTVDYSNSTGIIGGISVVMLDSVNKVFIPSIDSFAYINQIGFFSSPSINPNNGIFYNIIELSDRYEFKCTIVCKSKGVYYLSIDDASSTGLIGKNCTNSSIKATLQISSHNEVLYTNAIGNPPNTEPLSRMFCFRVL